MLIAYLILRLLGVNMLLHRFGYEIYWIPYEEPPLSGWDPNDC